MGKKKRGFALSEALVALAIMLFLAVLSFKLISTVLQRAKVVSAKAQIAQLALILENIKADTNLYPVFLQDMTSSSPPVLHENGWEGAYTRKVPLDPWGTPYFYQIPPTTLFNSPPIPRSPGTPDTYTEIFETNPGTALLRIENYGVTSCSVYLNGVKVVNENEFKKNPKPQIIEKIITLEPGNNLVTWARSKPGEFLIVSVSADNVPTKEYFILGSYCKDRQAGGTGFSEDIVWRSDRYPNFL